MAEELGGLRAGSSASSENYALGYEVASEAMAARPASLQTAFFLPYLRPGMTFLDCGCDPGTITISLAAHVPESMFTGMDLS